MTANISKHPICISNLFHPLLDSDYLLTFYDGDLEDILWAFQTFHKITLKDFFKLLPLAEANDWQGVSAIAHKLKPNFKLVGLTEWYDDLYHLELADYNNADICLKSYQVITLLEEKMKATYIPILKVEINRIDQILNQVQET